MLYYFHKVDGAVRHIFAESLSVQNLFMKGFGEVDSVGRGLCECILQIVIYSYSSRQYYVHIVHLPNQGLQLLTANHLLCCGSIQ